MRNAECRKSTASLHRLHSALCILHYPNTSLPMKMAYATTVAPAAHAASSRNAECRMQKEHGVASSSAFCTLHSALSEHIPSDEDGVRDDRRAGGPRREQQKCGMQNAERARRRFIVCILHSAFCIIRTHPF